MKAAEQAKKIEEWIEERVQESGTQGVVFGLSGGVDSAVVAALCRNALGDNVLGLIMPCESSPRDREDAEKVAAVLGIRTQVVELDPVYDSFLDALPKSAQFVSANMKPRIRMTALYYFSNVHTYLVVGTSNKSEIMMGYSTKYGDGGADILPLGDLYKSEVRELAAELGIPREIIEKAPSAGLWEGQTDEREMGVSYHELDSALRAIESGNTKDADPEIVRKVKIQMNRSMHKRSMPPIFKAKT